MLARSKPVYAKCLQLAGNLKHQVKILVGLHGGQRQHAHLHTLGGKVLQHRSTLQEAKLDALCTTRKGCGLLCHNDFFGFEEWPTQPCHAGCVAAVRFSEDGRRLTYVLDPASMKPEDIVINDDESPLASGCHRLMR